MAQEYKGPRKPCGILILSPEGRPAVYDLVSDKTLTKCAGLWINSYASMR